MKHFKYLKNPPNEFPEDTSSLNPPMNPYLPTSILPKRKKNTNQMTFTSTSLIPIPSYL